MTSRQQPEQQRKAVESPLSQLLFRGPFTTLADSIARQAGALRSRVNVEELLPGGSDPSEGLIPDDTRPDITSYDDWFNPLDWMGATPENAPGIDFAAIPSPGTNIVQGSGMDFFRSSEAPNNYANRHSPLYKARALFAASTAGQIEDLFGVQAAGVNYYRPPSPSDAAPGGRSANSDHYSAGAIDFYGSDERLDALHAWLIEQPFISFVRWRSESHHDHLHASFDIGWIAQNYGQEPPTFSKVPSPLQSPEATARSNTVRTATRQREATETPREPSQAAPPTITPGRPS